MPLESLLVRCHTGAGPSALARVAAATRAWGGQVLLSLPASRALLVALEHNLRDRLRTLPGVELVGGVEIGPRQVRRTRTPAGPS